MTELRRLQNPNDPDDIQNAVPDDGYPGWLDLGPVTAEDERSLANRKADAIARMIQLRDAAEFGGVSIPGIGTVQTDSLSRERISGAVQMAFIARESGAAFSIDWTLADNSVVTLDADGMIGVGLAVGTRANACHARGREIRRGITDAATVAELEAIDMETGWPE